MILDMQRYSPQQWDLVLVWASSFRLISKKSNAFSEGCKAQVNYLIQGYYKKWLLASPVNFNIYLIHLEAMVSVQREKWGERIKWLGCGDLLVPSDSMPCYVVPCHVVYGVIWMFAVQPSSSGWISSPESRNFIQHLLRC